MSDYREKRPGAGASHQEQSGSHYRTHEELVTAFRDHVKDKQRDYREQLNWDLSPEKIIRMSLTQKYNEGAKETPRNRAKEDFFQTLTYAWDILVYDRLDRQSQYSANNRIAEAYDKHPLLTLNDTQVSILDAAAEAVGISRPRGQREIPVPEKHNYWPLGHNGPGAIDPVTGGPGNE
jgi:hypothetical protein